jgi:hypothetical protein
VSGRRLARTARAFTALDRDRRLLVVEAAALMVVAWTGVRTLRFLTLTRLLDRYAGRRAARRAAQRAGELAPDRAAVERVAWAIGAASARMPWATCLVQALASGTMLRARGVVCELRLGARLAGDGDRRIGGHAWIECADGRRIGDSSGFEMLTAPELPVHPPRETPATAATPAAVAATLEVDAALAAMLRGERVSWDALCTTAPAFVAACEDEGVTTLVARHLAAAGDDAGWPAPLVDDLQRLSRSAAAVELMQARELTRVLDALAAHDVAPLLLKGTALAYTVYDTPSARPRVDTDLLIRAADVPRVRDVLHGLGYTAPLCCDGERLFCQFPLERDIHGLRHRLDCHWKISTQAVFADLLTFEDASARSVPVPALGPHARTLAPADALLLACVHPAMHHRNQQPLVWLHDVHLLASTLDAEQFERFATAAVDGRVSAVCAAQLRLARARLHSPIPDRVLGRLAAPRQEPSAAYLQPGRTWRDELISSLRATPRWSERLQLLREIVLPGSGYMLQAYGWKPTPVGRALLPALYVHRALFGGWKMLAGQK